jgi:hypothetical protein
VRRNRRLLTTEQAAFEIRRQRLRVGALRRRQLSPLLNTTPCLRRDAVGLWSKLQALTQALERSARGFLPQVQHPDNLARREPIVESHPDQQSVFSR